MISGISQKIVDCPAWLVFPKREEKVCHGAQIDRRNERVDGLVGRRIVIRLSV